LSTLMRNKISTPPFFHTGTVSFDEFVKFTSIIKSMMMKCNSDRQYAQELFGPVFHRTEDPEWVKGAWNRAMANVDFEATEQAWDAIFLALDAKEGQCSGSSNGKGLSLAQSNMGSDFFVRQLFQDFNSDGSVTLDVEEITQGLESIGVHITQRQFSKLICTLDLDGDGEISFEDFSGAITMVRNIREEQKIKNARKEAEHMINQANARDKSRNLATSDISFHAQQPGGSTESFKISRVVVDPDQSSQVGLSAELQKRVAELGFASVDSMVSFLEQEKKRELTPLSSKGSSSSRSLSSKSPRPASRVRPASGNSTGTTTLQMV
jgi:Ca2+-binding EF-hand superfamily protein